MVDDGAKIDNLVQVGHNVHIRTHTVIAACVGISGSTTIGKRCRAGRHGGGKRDLRRRRGDRPDGIFKSISGAELFGSLWADAAKHFHRNAARFDGLEELARRVRRSSVRGGRDQGRQRRESGASTWSYAAPAAPLPHAARGPRPRVRARRTYRRAQERHHERGVLHRPLSRDDREPGVLILEAMAQASGILTFVAAGVFCERLHPFLLRGHRQGSVPASGSLRPR